MKPILKNSIFKQLNNFFGVDYKVGSHEKQPVDEVLDTNLNLKNDYQITMKATQWSPVEYIYPAVKVAVEWEIYFPEFEFQKPRKSTNTEDVPEENEQKISGVLKIAIDNPADNSQFQSGPTHPNLNYKLGITGLKNFEGRIFLDKFKISKIPSRDFGTKISEISDKDNTFDMFGKDLNRVLVDLGND